MEKSLLGVEQRTIQLNKLQHDKRKNRIANTSKVTIHTPCPINMKLLQGYLFNSIPEVATVTHMLSGHSDLWYIRN